MKNFTAKWKKKVGFSFTFFIIALLFLVIGFGTLGSVRSTGRSYELQAQHTGDAKEPSLIFHLTAPTDKDGKAKKVRLDNIYLNLGAVYSEKEAFELRVTRATSAKGTFSSALNAKITNPSVATAKADEKTSEGSLFNWIAPFTLTDSWHNSTPSSYSYVKLVSRTSNILVNEVVFSAELLNEDKEGTGEFVVLKAEVMKESVLPYNENAGETQESALKAASAAVDKQKMPTLSQSSFFRYGEKEAETLLTVAEMRRGGEFVAGDKYFGEKGLNSLSLSLTTLSTLIFGMSPFGVRFFPMLASFGILVVGYFLAKRLFNEKAGLAFSVVYLLCNLSFGLGHFGSPVMIGLFFLLLSFAICYRYYEDGMKKAAPSSVLPLGVAGLSGALAILCNSVLVIPVAGVLALFIAGAVKERRKGRAVLDEAIEAAEAEEQAQGENAEAKSETPAKQNLRKVLGDYRYKTNAAVGVFACALIIGAFVLSLLFALPASYAVVKLYSDPAASSMNLFTVAWKLFAGGFTTRGGANFAFFYCTFTGSGSLYAITLATINPAALLAGLLGIAFAIYRIVKIAKNKEGADALLRVLLPLIGLVLCLVAAAFAAHGVAFVFGAYVLSFLLVGGGDAWLAERNAKAEKIVRGFGIALLVALFGLYAAFTFSIPLSSSLIAKIF